MWSTSEKGRRKDTSRSSLEWATPEGGILGAGYTKQTELTAGIIDMRRANQAGVVTSTVGSAGFYGLFGIFPVIIPAVTESPACERLGLEVVKFLSSGTEGESAAEGP